MPHRLLAGIHLGLALAVFNLAPTASAQCWEQHLETGAAGATRPQAVAAGTLPSGLEVVALGQPRNNHAGSALIQDEVHLFERAAGGFEHVATLLHPDAVHADDSFGVELAIAGDLLAVGDPAYIQSPGNSGAVHLYRRTPAGWAFEETLPAPSTGLTTQLFGQSLDLEGSTLVVGAPASTSQLGGTIEDGVVFVFERGPGGWTLAQSIVHPTNLLFGFFGADVALDGEDLAIGSPGDPSTSGTQGVGAIYLYERGAAGFAPSDRLEKAPAVPGGFGRSVALSGGVLAAGAAGETVAGEFAGGRVYIFEEAASGWSQTARLEEPPVRAYHRFGDSVLIADGKVFATSSGTTAVHGFARSGTGWTSTQRYTTAAGVSWPLQLETRAAVIGDAVVLSDQTGATVFSGQPAASAAVGCDGLPQPTANPGVAPPAYLDLRSEVRLSNPSTEFLMIGGAPGTNGILFYGFTPTNVPLGTGNLCVTGSLARATVGSSSGGLTQLSLDHTAAPVAGSGPNVILPGLPVHFQYWFRVPGGSHTTNSLVVSYCP